MKTSIGVVIPAYNSAPYVDATLTALNAAADEADASLHVVVVDDGSTDGTVDVVSRFPRDKRLAIDVITTENKGAFLARWNGAQKLDNDWIFFLDSRQLVRPDFVANLIGLQREQPDVHAWISHTETDQNAPLVGHFWEVPTFAFWGAYHRNREQTFITPENFDRYPKGTTAIAIRRESFIESCEAMWPKENQKFISDDTKLLRNICEKHPMALHPELFSTYVPRVNLKSFLSHSYKRGTLFVDSYAKTSALRFGIIAAIVAAPLVGVIATVLLGDQLRWAGLALVLGAFIAVVGGLIGVALFNRASIRGVKAFLLYLIPFGAVFWAGLARGLYIHRAELFRK